MSSKEDLISTTKALRSEVKGLRKRVAEVERERDAAYSAQRKAQAQAERYRKRDRLNEQLDEIEAEIEKNEPKSLLSTLDEAFRFAPQSLYFGGTRLT